MNGSALPDVTVRRTYQVYLYTVCFVTVLVVLFALAQFLYGLVRVAAPGTTGSTSFSGFGRTLDASGERNRGVAEVIQNLILGGLAAGIFAFHWAKSVEVRADLERTLAPPDAPAGSEG